MIAIVIYVSELRPDLLDEACGKLYLIVNKVQQNSLKKLVIGSAADFSHAGRFVIDLAALKDANEEIVEAVAAFKAMYPDIRVVAIADREPETSPLLSRLVELGVYDIVADLSGGSLNKCLTAGMSREEAESRRIEKPDLTAKAARRGEPEPPPGMHEEPQAEEKITANKGFKKHKPFVAVAVCGTQAHIGATHHALLATKFLCSAGFRACYLEANSRRNIMWLARAHAVNANERKHLLQYGGIDMYFDFKLPEVIAEGYDFYIFDFGSFGEFELASFLTKDIKMVVGGAKAWEMPAYNAVFEAIEGSRGIRFILNHAPPGEADEIRALMGGCRTHFSEHAPNPFASGVNTEMYKDIFGDYLTVERTAAKQPERSAKQGFFGRRR